MQVDKTVISPSSYELNNEMSEFDFDDQSHIQRFHKDTFDESLPEKCIFFLQHVVPSKQQNAVHLFGVDTVGRSVCFVKSFKPVVYVAIPESFTTGNCEDLVDVLNSKFGHYRHHQSEPPITNFRIRRMKKFVGYSDKLQKILELEVQSYHHIGSKKSNSISKKYGKTNKNLWTFLVEEGVEMNMRNLKFPIYNEIVTLRMQFLNKYNIQQSSWVAVNGLSDEEPATNDNVKRYYEEITLPKTTCRRTAYCKQVRQVPDKYQQKLGKPSRVFACFDIETISAKGPNSFGNPKNVGDLITNIGTVLYKPVSDDSNKQSNKCYIMHVLGKCDRDTSSGIPGTCADNPVVFRFSSEADMLSHWSKLMFQTLDVDVLLGYNSIDYDLNYISQRADVLECSSIMYMDRYLDASSYAKETNGKHKVYLKGRLHLDIMVVVFNMPRKFKSYKLKDIAKELLRKDNENASGGSVEKMDFAYSALYDFFVTNNAEKKWKVAQYCMQDCDVTLEIMIQHSQDLGITELAKLTSTDPQDLVSKGKQKLVWNVLNRFLYCDPNSGKSWLLNTDLLDQINGDGDEKYKGAVVIEPLNGYAEWISILDFASLYPSIMEGFNLCYSTIIYDKQSRKDAISKGLVVIDIDLPGGDCVSFVQPPGGLDGRKNGKWGTVNNADKGLIPRTLAYLVRARRETRSIGKDFKKKGDLFTAEVYNQRQLAYKIVCNTLYGFTGTPKDKAIYRCPWIARATTTLGRWMLDVTTHVMESDILTKVQDGEDPAEVDPYLTLGPSPVVYGDTDSVMVKFNNKPLSPDLTAEDAARARLDPLKHSVDERAPHNYAMLLYKISERACRIATERFPKPNLLEFEKLAARYMLYRKKKYCGLIYENIETMKSSMLHKGIVTQRRDSSAFTRDLCNALLERIVKYDRPGEIRGILSSYLNDLVEGKYTAKDLEITVGVSNPEIVLDPSAITKPLKHVHVACKMYARTGRLPPKRLGLVPVICSDRNTKDFMHWEESSYVMANKCAIDLEFFFNKCVKKPVTRILQFVISDHELQSILRSALGKIIFKKQRVANVFHIKSSSSSSGSKTCSKGYVFPPLSYYMSKKGIVDVRSQKSSSVSTKRKFKSQSKLFGISKHSSKRSKNK